MSAFAWLHLTDLHAGIRDLGGPWDTVRDSLLNDLRQVNFKIDAVLFTGDVTQCAEPEQFTKANKVIQQILDRIEAVHSHRPAFFSVPGNHDLVRPSSDDAAHLASWPAEDQSVQEEFWKKPKSKGRQIIKAAFKNYDKWWRKWAEQPRGDVSDLCHGQVPGDFSVTLKADNRKIGLVGLNTAFLHTGDGASMYGNLALDQRQLRAVCGDEPMDWANKHDLCLLMTHHPQDWLCARSKSDLQTHINHGNRFSLHLCGHDHIGDWRTSSKDGLEYRYWLGESLYGREKVNKGKGEQIDRMFGYCIGRVAFEARRATMNFYPRRASEKWAFVRDQDRLPNDGAWTGPVTVKEEAPVDPTRHFESLLEEVARSLEGDGVFNRWTPAASGNGNVSADDLRRMGLQKLLHAANQIHEHATSANLWICHAVKDGKPSLLQSDEREGYFDFDQLLVIGETIQHRTFMIDFDEARLAALKVAAKCVVTGELIIEAPKQGEPEKKTHTAQIVGIPIRYPGLAAYSVGLPLSVTIDLRSAHPLGKDETKVRARAEQLAGLLARVSAWQRSGKPLV